MFARGPACADSIARMPRTLFVARLWFEGNRFSARPTTMADFEQREWRRGAPALAAAAGTATELGALASFAASAAGRGWQLRIGRCAAANPGGPIEEAVFQAWLDELQRDLAAGPVDAVYLSLHGAAITTSRDSPELDALQALRQASAQLLCGFRRARDVRAP